MFPDPSCNYLLCLCLFAQLHGNHYLLLYTLVETLRDVSRFCMYVCLSVCLPVCVCLCLCVCVCVCGSSHLRSSLPCVPSTPRLLLSWRHAPRLGMASRHVRAHRPWWASLCNKFVDFVRRTPRAAGYPAAAPSGKGSEWRSVQPAPSAPPQASADVLRPVGSVPVRIPPAGGMQLFVKTLTGIAKIAQERSCLEPQASDGMQIFVASAGEYDTYNAKAKIKDREAVSPNQQRFYADIMLEDDHTESRPNLKESTLLVARLRGGEQIYAETVPQVMYGSAKIQNKQDIPLNQQGKQLGDGHDLLDGNIHKEHMVLLLGGGKLSFVETLMDMIFTTGERVCGTMNGDVEPMIRDIPTDQWYVGFTYVQLVDGLIPLEGSASYLVLGPQVGMRIFSERLTCQPQDLSQGVNFQQRLTVYRGNARIFVWRFPGLLGGPATHGYNYFLNFAHEGMNTSGERGAVLSLMYLVAAVAASCRSSGSPQARCIALTRPRSITEGFVTPFRISILRVKGGTSREARVHLYSAPVPRADPTPIVRAVQPLVP